MSPTTTITTEGPFSSSASSFITLVGHDDKQPSKPDEPKTIEKPVFVLNSADFVSLQAYLIAGIHIPANEAIYNAEYPKAAFEQFFKVETDLYEGLRAQLLLIHQHCEQFQGQVVTPMITTGGMVADFGEYSKDSVAEIVEALKTLVDPNVTPKDPRFDDSKGTVRGCCRKIVKRAEEVKNNCDQLIKDLGDFRAKTEGDKNELVTLDERFKKVMPPKEEQDSTMKKLIDDAKALLDAAAQAIDNERKDLEEIGQARWYYYIPQVGTTILIFNMTKRGKLLERINESIENFKDAEAKGAEDQVKLAGAYTVINHLAGDMNSILATIDGAISSVTKMSTAFSKLSTDFSKVKSFMTDVEGDIDDETLEERGIAIKDLEKAKKIWESVETLGRDFQLHGGLLAFDPNNPPKQG